MTALDVLTNAGSRGASHEDFVEAGLGTAYVDELRELVEARGFAIRVDFTTGAARWALAPVGGPGGDAQPRALRARLNAAATAASAGFGLPSES